MFLRLNFYLIDLDQSAFARVQVGLANNVPNRRLNMTRLMMILFSMISTTLMGVGVIVALTTGNDTLQPILISAAIGFVLALPVSWYIAKQLQ
jgi:hypothetical protein